MNKNQTNQNNGDRVAGTGLSTLSPRDSSATPPLRNGASGEKSTDGNRNKK